MSPTLFDTPPTGADLMADLAREAADRDRSILAALELPNVRPDDVDNARRAAAKVHGGRKNACAEVYDYVREHWPTPVEGRQVRVRFIDQMSDPERRLRELRTALVEAGIGWAVTNVNGRWSIEETGF